MSPPAPRRTIESPWEKYGPSDEMPWDRRRVVHLHRRAGFAATPDEVKRDLKDGPVASVDRILNGKARDERTPPGFEATAKLLADSAIASGDPARLKAAWILRMLVGPDPLGERLTLLWHNHFATSNAKVEDLAAMWRQNETLRRFARAPFGELLEASMREPALLTWLDAPSNRKGHPNENLARELMELFTLGIGHYNETDVKEAARALTGWTVKEGEFVESKSAHDDGDKAILGITRRWSGADLLKALREHPATATRIARKLCGSFFGEQAIDATGIESLADELRANDLNIGQGVATILRSRTFFSKPNLHSRVIGPVEFVVSSAVALSRLDPPPSTLLLADWAGRTGQDLFYPPNVGGWSGGRSWLAARGLIGRANYSAALVNGVGVGNLQPLDAVALADREGDGDPIVAASRLLFGHDPEPEWRDRMTTSAGTARDADAARRAMTLALASPEAQLD